MWKSLPRPTSGLTLFSNARVTATGWTRVNAVSRSQFSSHRDDSLRPSLAFQLGANWFGCSTLPTERIAVFEPTIHLTLWKLRQKVDRTVFCPSRYVKHIQGLSRKQHNWWRVEAHLALICFSLNTCLAPTIILLFWEELERDHKEGGKLSNRRNLQIPKILQNLIKILFCIMCTTVAILWVGSRHRRPDMQTSVSMQPVWCTINVCQRWAPRSNNMCIVSIRIGHQALFLQTIEIVHFTLDIVSIASIWSGHKSGAEVTLQSWSSNSRDFLLSMWICTICTLDDFNVFIASSHDHRVWYIWTNVFYKSRMNVIES